MKLLRKITGLRQNWQEYIDGNPIIVKELRGRMRGSRAFLTITFYLLILSSLVSLVYLGFVTSSNRAITLDLRQTLGKALFGTAIGFQLLTVCFIAPALTAGAISSERERKTYELLRTTLLPARAIVTGKLESALVFIAMLLFSAFPLQSLAFIFGGVSFSEIAVGNLLLIITAIAFSAIGIFFSSFTHRTLVSTILANGLSILIVFGIPFLIMLIGSFFGGALSGSSPTRLTELIIMMSIYLMVSINPLASAIASEVILVQEQSLLFFQLPLPTGGTLLIISPWIIYIFIFSLFSLLLLRLSILMIRKTNE